MSEYVGRKFKIIEKLEFGHFYGANKGDIVIACDPGFSSNDIWVKPSENPCIIEPGWKDYSVLCFACVEEIGVYIEEVHD